MKVYMITKDKTVVEIKANSAKPYLIWNEGVYKLESDAVNLHANGSNLNPIPEIIFFEDNPIPLGSVGLKNVLTEVVVKNALENVVDEKPFSLSWIKDLFNPVVIFGAIIVIAVVTSLLRGGGIV